MNLFIKDFENAKDTGKIVDLVNTIVERHNEKEIKSGEYLTITYKDERKYRVAINPKEDVIAIERLK